MTDIQEHIQRAQKTMPDTLKTAGGKFTSGSSNDVLGGNVTKGEPVANISPPSVKDMRVMAIPTNPIVAATPFGQPGVERAAVDALSGEKALAARVDEMDRERRLKGKQQNTRSRLGLPLANVFKKTYSDVRNVRPNITSNFANLDDDVKKGIGIVVVVAVAAYVFASYEKGGVTALGSNVTFNIFRWIDTAFAIFCGIIIINYARSIY